MSFNASKSGVYIAKIILYSGSPISYSLAIYVNGTYKKTETGFAV